MGMIMATTVSYALTLSDQGRNASELEKTINSVRRRTPVELYSILLAGNSSPLADTLWPNHDPCTWLSDYSYREIYRVLWIASGIIEKTGHEIPFVDEAVKTLTPEIAASHLVATAAFIELCQRGDTNAWTYLKERTMRAPSLLDICIAGKLVWGDSLPLVPAEKTEKFSLDDNPISPCEWILPKVSADAGWVQLYRGTNGVYRLLALEGISTWADTDTKPSLLIETSDDKYYAIGYAWRAVVRELDTDNQNHLYQNALKMISSRMENSASQEEIKQELENRLQNAINTQNTKMRDLESGVNPNN